MARIEALTDTKERFVNKDEQTLELAGIERVSQDVREIRRRPIRKRGRGRQRTFGQPTIRRVTPPQDIEPDFLVDFPDPPPSESTTALVGQRSHSTRSRTGPHRLPSERTDQYHIHIKHISSPTGSILRRNDSFSPTKPSHSLSPHVTVLRAAT